MSIWDLLYGAAALAGLPVWLVKLATDPKWRHRLPDRFARYPDMKNASGPRLWLHAASVGEVRSACALVAALENLRTGLSLIITTQSKTGWEEAAHLYPRAAVLKFPLDFGWTMDRAFDRIRPSAVVLVESEFWPNLVRISGARAVPVVVVNGSISKRSFARFSRVRRLITPTFQGITRILAQTDADRDRFAALGAPPGRVEVAGNLKFDLAARTAGASPLAAAVAKWRGAAPLWIAASTHEGEEAAVLGAFHILRGSFPALRLVLAPRHPDRFERVASLLHDSGLPFLRRSSLSSPPFPSPPLPVSSQVFLLDSVGELFWAYGAASVAFVGGSLVPVGGHNLLEPAAWGVPSVWGPHANQFAQIARGLAASGGGREVADAAGMEQGLAEWLSNEPERRSAGEKARAFVEAHRGTSESVAKKILVLLNEK